MPTRVAARLRGSRTAGVVDVDSRGWVTFPLCGGARSNDLECEHAEPGRNDDEIGLAFDLLAWLAMSWERRAAEPTAVSPGSSAPVLDVCQSASGAYQVRVTAAA